MFIRFLNENVWRSQEKDFSEIVPRFYKIFFTSTQPAIEKKEELATVQPLVKEKMNNFLKRGFSIEEIIEALFAVSADKSRLPDGMME